MITGKSIAKGAMVVMGATLLSRLFGFFREMVIANRFGATGETDAYLVAFSVPVGVAMAVAAGISAGFIPVLNSYLVQQDREDANKVANTLINIVFVVLALTVGAAMAGAPFLVRLLAPGFSGEALALTVEMIRIMFPALAFVSLMGIASGFLNSHRHFLFPALGPLIASVFIIGAAVILGPAMGIRGLAVGTLAGVGAEDGRAGIVNGTKHYVFGKYSPEMALVMPDERTVYITDDGPYAGLFMFVADKARDLSRGTLYMAIWTREGREAAGSGAISSTV